MTIDSMAIHDTQHPKIINAVKVLLDDETVLVNFAHLGYVACASLVRNGLDKLSLASYGVPNIQVTLDPIFILGSGRQTTTGRLVLSSDIDTGEVGTRLYLGLIVINGS